MKKIIAMFLLIIFWFITLILGLSLVGLLIIAAADKHNTTWFTQSEKLIEIIKA